ncbi:MAG: hypothetical protein KGY74_10565 [Candidatus Cloacimonetes bacterium]|nr:hypothetical protein [Candidatus Cloacimonadota bacterium]
MNNNILHHGIMHWRNLEKLFPVKVNPYIYNRDTKAHFDPGIIKSNAVISVDGQEVTGYQSHFLAVDGKGKDTLFAYDPWRDCIVDIMEIYNKGSLKQSVFTIVNMKKE